MADQIDSWSMKRRDRSFQHSGKRPDRTDPIYRGGLGAGAWRTKSAYKWHILPRSHPHSKTGYDLENQTVFELTSVRKKAPLFPAIFPQLPARRGVASIFSRSRKPTIMSESRNERPSAALKKSAISAVIENGGIVFRYKIARHYIGAMTGRYLNSNG